MPSSGAWVLQEFIPRLDSWIAQESPAESLRFQALAWIFTRYDDPYRGASRAEGFDNLWFAKVPETLSDGRMLTCSYFIFERERRVLCDTFAVLSVPFS